MTVILHKEYSKDELLQLCEQLDIPKFSMTDTSKALIDKINEDLDTNGVPTDEDCSDLLYNYLCDAGYIEGEEVDEEPELEQVIEVEPMLENLPDCYGFADDRDKACKICRVFAQCMEERTMIREQELPCFGKLFDANAEECGMCLEAGPCRLIVTESIKIIN